MERSEQRGSRFPVRILIGLAAAIALNGCADYVKRRDTVTFHAGETQAWNRAVQMEDPWPPYAANTRIVSDGQRVQRAMERYTRGANAPSDGAPAPTPAAPNGAPPVGPSGE